MIFDWLKNVASYILSSVATVSFLKWIDSDFIEKTLASNLMTIVVGILAVNTGAQGVKLYITAFHHHPPRVLSIKSNSSPILVHSLYHESPGASGQSHSAPGPPG